MATLPGWGWQGWRALREGRLGSAGNAVACPTVGRGKLEELAGAWALAGRRGDPYGGVGETGGIGAREGSNGRGVLLPSRKQRGPLRS